MADQHAPDKWVLGAGVFLILTPIAIAVMWPTVLISAEFYLRVISAIGGGLIGGFIPGALQFDSPWLKATGAAGIFAVIYSTNPAVIAADAAHPPKPAAASTADPSAKKLSEWLFPQGTLKLDKSNYGVLARWINSKGDLGSLPVSILLNDKNLSASRQEAIKELNIP